MNMESCKPAGNDSHESPDAIAIVGAGFSGAMVAAHLLRQATTPLTVYLIERMPERAGLGNAYSTPLDGHWLNVPAGNMSAFADEPLHFLHWAQAGEQPDAGWGRELTAHSFLPRRLYGRYIRHVLNTAEQTAKAGVRLERISGEVMGAGIGEDDVTLHLADGSDIRVRKAVLAVGNFPPGNPYVRNPAFHADSRYHANPWNPEVLPKLLPTRSCLLIGSGLTMVDWVIGLQDAGYQGALYVVSRRGLWPQTHDPGVTSVPFVIDYTASPPTVRAWLRQIRQYIHTTGCDWRSVVDALRPLTPTLWQHLPLIERRRFLRHLRPFWDIHRHRLAPEVARRLAAWQASGKLVRRVGRIEDYRVREQIIEVLIRSRGTGEPITLPVEAVVNCSGCESNYRNLPSPLIRQLLDQGSISLDSLALGLNATTDGRLIDAGGVVSDRLFTVGPPAKGILWETIAVPEIRVQAERLARCLLD